MQTAPVVAVVVPLRTQFGEVLAELFDPGEVLEVVGTALVDVRHLEHVVDREALEAIVIAVGLALVVGPALGGELGEPGLVERHRVGEHGEDDVVFAKLVVFGELDCGDEVADA